MPIPQNVYLLLELRDPGSGFVNGMCGYTDGKSRHATVTARDKVSAQMSSQESSAIIRALAQSSRPVVQIGHDASPGPDLADQRRRLAAPELIKVRLGAEECPTRSRRKTAEIIARRNATGRFAQIIGRICRMAPRRSKTAKIASKPGGRSTGRKGSKGTSAGTRPCRRSVGAVVRNINARKNDRGKGAPSRRQKDSAKRSCCRLHGAMGGKVTRRRGRGNLVGST